MVPELRIHA